MFTLMCDIFIMCFVLSEILSLEEEEEYSRSLFPSAAAAAAAAAAALGKRVLIWRKSIQFPCYLCFVC
jgi:hypothetical protein